jgi:hypothetical protein
MSDLDPLNDSEFDELERRLTGIALSPTLRERERLLYACGQAAGRAQMMRRVRNTTTIAALLGCTCVGLVTALVLLEKSPPVAGISPPPRTASRPADGVREQESPNQSRDIVVDRNRQLTVAGGLRELVLAELPQKIIAPRESTAKLAAEPALTTAGPLPVEL